MNPPAPARIALAAILFFAVPTAFGAEKDAVSTLAEIKRSLVGTESNLLALLARLETLAPSTAEAAVQLRVIKLDALYTLGCCKPTVKEYRVAIPHLLEASALCDPFLRPDEWDKVHYRLAIVQKDQGKFAEGLLVAKAVHHHRTITLGAEHPDTLKIASLLAFLQKRTGDKLPAISLFIKTLIAQERDLGPEHPDTISTMNDFAELCARKQEYSFAAPYLRRVLQFRERTLGPDHPDTLRTTETLAGCCRYDGSIVEAESLYSRVVEARERTLGPESYSTLCTKETLAGMLYPRALELEDQREYERTTSLYHQLLDASEHAGSTAREKNISYALRLAKLYQRHHEFATALPLAEQALAASLKVWGEGHEITETAKKLVDDLKKTK